MIGFSDSVYTGFGVWFLKTWLKKQPDSWAKPYETDEQPTTTPMTQFVTGWDGVVPLH